MATTPRHYLTADVIKRQPWVAVVLAARAQERARGRLRPHWLATGELVSVPLNTQAATVPGARTSVVDAEATSRAMAERFADGAVLLLTPTGTNLCLLVPEVQLSRKEEKKLRWPEYLTGFRSRYGCPTDVLVVCFDDATAEWSAEPIRLGLGDSQITPLVVTPADFPIDIPTTASVEDRLLLATIAYAGHPEDDGLNKIIAWTYGVLWRTDRAGAVFYAEFIASVVRGEAYERLVENMRVSEDIIFESPIAMRSEAKGRTEGRAEGRAEDILHILDKRGLTVPAHVRSAILGCRDVATLSEWFDRALDAATATEVIAAEPSHD